uniref:ATP synthase complex subunit 8 n=2 Tax=Sphyraena TaxID=13691 RepID=T2HTR2_SPHBA|nr:ATP synthase F0 subunit 8 [Sphyraena barracuda]YP_009235697.1 ATP synthase F0 subunit 8 [Sphyraena jello]AMD38538.1 ATP synthase F0 subunit 8 [Sphyraena jello]BAN83390.1 ATPase subunit 8 [Sphyraena barracuda]
MPQLDPAPWFPILILCWTVFLIFIPPKVMAHTQPNQPTPQSAEKSKETPWTWPWY